MSYLLDSLETKEDIDRAITKTTDIVLVLRFGRNEDSTCLQQDHLVRFKWKLTVWFDTDKQSSVVKAWPRAVRIIWCFPGLLNDFDILHARKKSEPAPVGLRKLKIIHLQMEAAFLALFWNKYTFHTLKSIKQLKYNFTAHFDNHTDEQ